LAPVLRAAPNAERRRSQFGAYAPRCLGQGAVTVVRRPTCPIREGRRPSSSQHAERRKLGPGVGPLLPSPTRAASDQKGVGQTSIFSAGPPHGNAQPLPSNLTPAPSCWRLGRCLPPMIEARKIRSIRSSSSVRRGFHRARAWGGCPLTAREQGGPRHGGLMAIILAPRRVQAAV